MASVKIVESESGLEFQRELAHLQSREIQQIGNQARLRQGVTPDRLSSFDHELVIARFLTAQQDFRIADDGVKRIAQLVREGREKFILQPVGCFSFGACFVLAFEKFIALGLSLLTLVMSRAILDAPTTRPSWFLIGEMVSDTSIRLPSLRRRTVSK